jgi:hypothetical protein
MLILYKNHFNTLASLVTKRFTNTALTFTRNLQHARSGIRIALLSLTHGQPFWRWLAAYAARTGSPKRFALTLLLHRCYTVVALWLHCFYNVFTRFALSGTTTITLQHHNCYSLFSYIISVTLQHCLGAPRHQGGSLAHRHPLLSPLRLLIRYPRHYRSNGASRWRQR